jgi:hypothetical protein
LLGVVKLGNDGCFGIFSQVFHWRSISIECNQR